MMPPSCYINERLFRIPLLVGVRDQNQEPFDPIF
jgi:hypothetical protein